MEQMFQSDKRKIKVLIRNNLVSNFHSFGFFFQAENDELKASLDEAKAENIVLKEKYDNEIKEVIIFFLHE